MKQGKYFRIPERPADIECLWQTAARLELPGLPAWLTREDADRYRYIGSVSCADRVACELERYFGELEEVKAAGVVVWQDPDDHRVHHLYVAVPVYDQVWSIGIYVGGSPFSLGPSPDVDNPVLTREDVSDVAAVFVADPFMVRANDAWHMFFEVMNWRSGKGEIGLAISTDGTRWTYRQIVLAEPFHLSYPYVFEWAGDYYMIPESYQAGAVRLYRAQPFPMEWAFVGDLLTGSYLVDASIVRFGDRWWLFTETNPEVKHDTLRLYHAEDLSGPWHEHPRSPIVRGDPRIARPGGRVLVLNDRVVRYAQTCYPAYGTEVRAFEVIELTTTAYHEREVAQNAVLRPSGTGWNALGMHHIDAHLASQGRWVACVDGREEVRTWRALDR